MKYVSRLGIIFVAVLFASRVSASMNIEDQWYMFFLALFIAGLNALVRSVIELFDGKISWSLILFLSLFINVVLYALIAAGSFAWLGVTAPSFGSLIGSILIVTFVSMLCNHFMGFKRKSD